MEMAFTARDLAQLGAIFISLVGAFITARMQIKALVEKMTNHEKRLLSMDHRLDDAESARAVIDSRLSILSDINSVDALAYHNRQMAGMDTRLQMLTEEVQLLRKLHNCTHPYIGTDLK